MALTGFPNQIQVTLGTSFIGSAALQGLNNGDVLVLTKVTGQDYWTENGTNIPSATNRIRFAASQSGSNGIVQVQGQFNNYGSSWGQGSSGGFNFGPAQASVGADYAFKEVWSASVTGNFTIGGGSSSPGINYNGRIFSSMSEYAASPVADFSADQVSGAAPLTVQFTDTSTNTPTSWDWDFGDGSSHGTTQNPSHVYSTVGPYTVILIATNTQGSGSKTKTNYINVILPGEIWAWGDNSYGEFGNNSIDSQSSPVSVATVSFREIATGLNTSYAIDTAGMVWAWGYNYFGALGTNDTVDRSIPVNIARPGSYTAIGCQKQTEVHRTGFAIDGSTGMIWTWGSNECGMLGNNEADSSGGAPVHNYSRSSPVSVARLGSYKAVSAGYKFVAAIDASDGSIWTWGYGASGVLGNNTSTARSSPGSIVRPGSYTAISCGGQHTASIDSNGMIWTWGVNTNGQLGDGSKSTRLSPVSIARSGVYTAIASGFYHTLAIDGSDGMVWAWGRGTNGQLGNGDDSSDQSSPVSIARVASYTAIAAGAYNSFAIDSDKVVWAWGLNDAGQLGLNDLDNRSSPVSVATAIRFSSISAHNHVLGLQVTAEGPTANFSADVTSGFVPLTVQFTDLSTNTPTSWDWDFGDGSSHSTSQNPSHTYAATGTYTVTLIATNAEGSDTKTVVDYIGVNASVSSPLESGRQCPMFVFANSQSISASSSSSLINIPVTTLETPPYKFNSDFPLTVKLFFKDVRANFINGLMENSGFIVQVTGPFVKPYRCHRYDTKDFAVTINTISKWADIGAMSISVSIIPVPPFTTITMSCTGGFAMDVMDSKAEGAV